MVTPATSSLKDFFKKKPSSQSEESQGSASIRTVPASPNKASPQKTLPVVVDKDEEQIFKRSTKTLVKSKTATGSAIKKSPPKKDPSSSAAAPVVKASPIKSPKKPSPVKVSPVKKTVVKRLVLDDDDDDFVEEEIERMPTIKKPAVAESIDPATPKAKNFNYREYLAKKNAVPVALGSKEIPEGAPNCLEGLAFVFTGDLASMTRDQATDLVKRYGGKVTGAPSRKTSYVVVGENPGPSKMEKIKALGLTTIDEDGLLELVRASNPTGKPIENHETPLPPSAASNTGVSKKKIEEQLERLEVEEKQKHGSASSPSELWTDKYAPHSSSEIIGNPGIYEKLREWLSNWTPSSEGDAQKAALLSGPPGIGKTTMVGVVCKELGFQMVEMNASDTRSKKTLHETVREVIDNTCLPASFFFSKTPVRTEEKKKQVLVMDEVDGMSAGDRGGMAELIQLIKKTRIPIICICNDRASPKVRSLANHCLDLRFRRPDARQVLPRIMAIAEKEGLEIQPNAIEELVASTHGDIRQLLNLLSTFKLTQSNLSYDRSKHFSIASAKDVEHGPFDATATLLGGQSVRLPLSQRLDQYFIDSSLVPLMVQENYLKCRANSPREIIGSNLGAKASFMELTAAAADAISLSERVDSFIHGTAQEWSLAPLHGMMSSVLPAYYVSGSMSGRIDFASWLGQYSKTGKYQRILNELTKHAFLHTRSGRLALRLDYLDVMLSLGIVNPLQAKGQEAIDTVIAFMDDYSLSRDDLDSLLELSLNPACNAAAFAKVPTPVRSALTRKYNQGVHRLPYSLAGSIVATKRIAAVPGAEGEEEDEGIIFAADDDDQSGADKQEDLSLDKDKMIKAKKPSAKRVSGTTSRGGGTASKRGRGAKAT